jgi:hypothetical protein
MSGGEQQAKPAVGRPLDGRVRRRPHRRASRHTITASPAATRHAIALAHSGILIPLTTTDQPRTKRSNCASATSTNTTAAITLNGFTLGLLNTMHYRHQMPRGLVPTRRRWLVRMSSDSSDCPTLTLSCRRSDAARTQTRQRLGGQHERVVRLHGMRSDGDPTQFLVPRRDS